MYVAHTYTVTAHIVPDSKHTTLYLRILFLETHVAYQSRRPTLVQIPVIQIVIVVACSRYYIHQPVRNRYQLVSRLLHVLRIGKTIVPDTHQHVFALYRRVTLSMSQRPPYHSLFAIALHQSYQMVSQTKEQLDHLLPLVAVLIRANVHPRSAEHRLRPLQVFREETVYERHDFRISQIQVVHAELLTAEPPAEMSESQRVSRHVYLRNNLDPQLGTLTHEVTELLLTVVPVARRELRETLAFQPEGRVRLVPVVVEVLLEPIVVQVNLQAVHLVVRHRSHQVLQVIHRDELPGHVNHKPAQPVVRPVLDVAARQPPVLLPHLQQRLYPPHDSLRCPSRHRYATRLDTYPVSLVASLAHILQLQHYPCRPLLILHPPHQTHRIPQVPGSILQDHVLCDNHDFASLRVKHPVGRLPRLQLRNRKRNLSHSQATGHDSQGNEQQSTSHHFSFPFN